MQARPAAVIAALAGTRLRAPVKLFIAWFGPKGVASMLFALLVLKSVTPNAELVFEIASFAILTSIVAHGLTETVGTRWIEERA
jgi:NhaP-type Na+/H+ and K+/H+ antiporter